MSTETYQLTVHGLTVDVVRKDIKHLHLAVYPPAGRVRVAVPRHVSDEAVRLHIIAKLSWIKRQQARFARQERQTIRDYVSGESHYYLGHRYRLQVNYRPGAPTVAVRNKTTLDLGVRPGSDTTARERALAAWYRSQLREVADPLLAKWEPIIGVTVADWGIKQMKTKWGTCNQAAGRIWLNLELTKKPMHCIEYVIVHELVHLLERRHNDRFTAYMQRIMPQWEHYREELNHSPLGHVTWDY